MPSWMLCATSLSQVEKTGRRANAPIGAWRYPEAWDMLMFGMRLGADPRYRGNNDAAAREIDPRSGA
jgi:hypothetical protein